MTQYIAAAPADPVAGQPGHLAFSQWTKESLLALDAILPVGFGGYWFTDTPPDGWALCDGSAHGSVALEAVLGSPNTPDLRQKVLYGASASKPLGTTGGAETVTLTAAQSGSPAHSHSASSGSTTASHTHSVSGTAASAGTHYHGSPAGKDYLLTEEGGQAQLTNSTGGYQRPTGFVDTTPSAGAHTHTVSGTAASGGAAHTHTVTVNNSSATNATQSHENMPPYRVVHWILKK